VPFFSFGNLLLGWIAAGRSFPGVRLTVLLPEPAVLEMETKPETGPNGTGRLRLKLLFVGSNNMPI
jgi:hypothetical protein